MNTSTTVIVEYTWSSWLELRSTRAPTCKPRALTRSTPLGSFLKREGRHILLADTRVQWISMGDAGLDGFLICHGIQFHGSRNAFRPERPLQGSRSNASWRSSYKGKGLPRNLCNVWPRTELINRRGCAFRFCSIVRGGKSDKVRMKLEYGVHLLTYLLEPRILKQIRPKLR